ncbi:oligomeric Golgi complex component [Cavenderia fasciculata]|uniref:Oligomeric Golgi complex component n=1 Tax=Cavenderia fasciculata TaxID=261658 RepID=F4Q420_CACFS|nr:oligomeric Golgi complex component [Cavenderia fasciculata]EGG16934.1 oligomeric Golgi complex component [Cavenderia fasciculata]|eukprot:XP_004355408.1 oligomeric Golgi complex component [Cavenderia fasciculata]
MFMVGIYDDEYEIYCDYFDKEKEMADFSELLDPFTQSMYDYVRPVYIHITDYELLCNLAHIIRNELLEEVISHSTKICLSLKQVFQRMLQDIQERLIYIIQTYIRDEISLHNPTQNDINYPDVLISAQTIVTPPPTPPLTSSTDNTTSTLTSSPPLILLPPNKSKGLYPTLEKTLTCLSKLYLVVDTKIFEGLAQEAVLSCMQSLIQASSLIANNKSNPLSLVDSQLFLIKYFITLREQITPFDINFVIEKIVDFPQLKHALQSLYNYGSLFKFSTNNPIYNILSSATNPRVTSTSIDAKKDLEKELKGVIETFIISTSNKIIDPLVALLTKISVFTNQQQQAAATQPTALLSSQPFATVERIKEVVEQVHSRIETDLPQVVERMKIYLTPSTLALLSKPIRTNIIDSFDQINQYSKKYYTDDQIKAMSLMPMETLRVLLDKHVPTQIIINQPNK